MANSKQHQRIERGLLKLAAFRMCISVRKGRILSKTHTNNRSMGRHVDQEPFFEWLKVCLIRGNGI